MESPAFFITVFVCDTPDRPPKTAENRIARAAGNPDIVRETASIPVVIPQIRSEAALLIPGVRRIRDKACQNGIQHDISADFDHNPREAIMISSNGLPSGAALQVTGKGEGRAFFLSL